MPKPSPRIPPLEYQQEIKRRFTVNEKSQTGLDRDMPDAVRMEICLQQRAQIQTPIKTTLLSGCRNS